MEKNLLKKCASKIDWRILFLVLIGLLTLTWFRGNFIIDTLDFSFPYDRWMYFKRLFFIWNNSNSLGFLDSRIFANLIPYGLLVGLFEAIQIPLALGEFLFVFLCFSGAGISMYFFCIQLKLNKNVAFLAALFYLFNPFAFSFIWPLRSLFILSYAFIPLALAHLLFLIQKKELLKKDIVIHATLIFIALTSSFSNPAIFAIYLIPAVIFCGFYGIARQSTRSFVILFASVGLITLLSTFWLLPFLSSITVEYENASPKISGESDLKALELSSKTALDSYSMTGFWALTSSYRDDPYFPWHDRFDSLAGILLRYFVFLGVVLYALLAKPSFIKYSLLTLTLGGIFFLTGTKDLLPEIKIFLFDTIPGIIRAFRSLETKVSPILLLGMLPAAAAGLLLFSEKFGKKALFIILSGFTAYILYLGWPAIDGSIIYPGGNVTPSSRVKIPKYYEEARQWFDTKDKNFKLISVPISTVYLTAYDWENGFVGTNPDRYLFGKTTLTNNTGENFIIPNTIANTLSEGKFGFEKIFRVAGLASIKYLVLHHDAKWDYIRDNKYWKNSTSEQLKLLAQSSDSVNFGQLSIVPVPDLLFHNILYSPDNIYSYSGNFQPALDFFTGSGQYKHNSVLLDVSDTQGKNIPNIKNIYILWDGTRVAEETPKSSVKYFFYDKPAFFEIIGKTDQKNYYIEYRDHNHKILSIKEKNRYADSTIIPLDTRDSSKKIAIVFRNELISWSSLQENSLEFLGKIPALGQSEIDTNSIDFYLESEKSLLKNGDFDSGSWGDVPRDCSKDLGGDPSMSLQYTNDPENDNYFVTLQTKDHISCIRSEQINLEKGLPLIFSVRYKSAIESKAGYCILDASSNSCIKKGILDGTGNWETFSTFVKTNSESEGPYSIYLYAYQNSTIHYDNINVASLSYKETNVLPNVQGEWIGLDEKPINFDIYATQNQIRNSSFEDGLWEEEVKDCSKSRPGDATISMKRIPSSYPQGEGHSLQIKTINRLACTSTDIYSYESGEYYEIQVDYKKSEHSKSKICILEQGPNRCIPMEDPVQQKDEALSNGWYRWKKIFNSSENAIGAKVFLYADSSGHTSSVDYDNIVIRKLQIPPQNIVVAYDNTETSEPENSSSKISFKRKNSTLIEVEFSTKRSFDSLVFTESFHPNWILSSARERDGKYFEIPKESHLKANGYANFWAIDVNNFCEKSLCINNPDGSRTLFMTLNFSSQRWFYLGLLISGTTLLACLGYLGYDFIRNRKLAQEKP